MTFRGSAILLDIEGTTSAIGYVHEVLFPFARQRIEPFLRTNWADPAVVRAARQLLVEQGGDVPLGRDGDHRPLEQAVIPQLVEQVTRLMDGDVKSTGLKELQGLIWEKGYAAGELRSHVYDDVPPALRAWAAAGLDVRIYSSGSIRAQKVFFGHTLAGDLTPFLRGHYDTTTGPKRSGSSYEAIALDIGKPPHEILFLSDVPQELDAAAATGMQCGLVIRPGNAPVSAADIAHPRLSDFGRINIPSDH